MINVNCPCGRKLVAREEFGGTRAECPACGRELSIPAASHPQPSAAASARDRGLPGASAPAEEPLQITEFLDPPSRPVAAKKPTFSFRLMFEALLDPRSIQWMLTIGGGLAVLGLLVWLASLGLFKNTLVLAACLGAGTLAILAGGWALVLKSKYKVAGQALTFLGCVVAPLNLWFYHAHDLLTLDQGLWMGGVVCCLLYVATVYVLRDPLFMYAVEAGITLTVLLLLANLGMVGDATYLSLFCAGLGLISIHAERAFAPGDDETFSRRRFGLPLFWSGQAQMAAALAILLSSQLAFWLSLPAGKLFGPSWNDKLLIESPLLAGGLWLVGCYAYLYSDLVVRRVGVYTYLATACLLMAEGTLVGMSLDAEGVIAALAITALAANLAQSWLGAAHERFQRAVPPLALGLSALPVVMGGVLHMRATSAVAKALVWDHPTTPWFVLAMLTVAVCNRVSAWLTRDAAPKWSAAYFFLSATGLTVAAAGLLRVLGIEKWVQQAPLLMVIPLGYVVASRLWRGQSPERPLVWVAQSITAVILLGGLGATVESLGDTFRTVEGRGNMDNLLLGLAFAEAAVFYVLAGLFRKRSANIYLAAAAGCASLWQVLGYFGMFGAWYPVLYSLLGLALLVAARRVGIEQLDTYGVHGQKGRTVHGRGLALFQSANAIVFVALLSAFLQGLAKLTTRDPNWWTLGALAVTAAVGGMAAVLVPGGGLRRLYCTSSVGLVGLIFLTLNVLSHLSNWQKVEIFSVVVGVLMVVSAYVGRFRETEGHEGDGVTIGLWLGSLMASFPLLVAVIYHRFVAQPQLISLPDELALLTVTILMLVTGVAWQFKASTLAGGGTLGIYLVVMIGSLAYQPQVAVGVYLAVGGALVFATGIALSIYREKLLALPDQIARREGIFQIIQWR